jgi:hypothetical protein
MDDEGMFLYLLLYRFELNREEIISSTVNWWTMEMWLTATKTESFSLKLKTEELTEGTLSYINTAYRSIIISSKNDTSFVATGKKFTTEAVRTLPQESDFPSERIWTMLTKYWEQ